MRDNWDFYFCNIEGEFASILLDLGLVDSTPIAELSSVGYVRIDVNPPPDRQHSTDGWEEIEPIETALEDRFAVDNSRYVARISTSSYREFYFYIPTDRYFREAVAEIMAGFPAHRYTVNIVEDGEWDFYRSFLYPAPAEQQSIENRKVCVALEQNGDLLTEPREIEQWVYFANESSCQAFGAEASQCGWQLDYDSDRNAASEPDRYSVRIATIDVPSFDNIDNVTLPVFRLAIEHEGIYDGWGCAVIAP
jgi:hypothetical protein